MYDMEQQDLSLDEKQLNYASYFVVKEFESLTDEKPTGVFFNKIMSLLNRRIDNFILSHYWYRYGDQVCRQNMPYGLEWTSFEMDRTKVNWKLDRFDYFDGLKGHPIEEEVKFLVEKYHNSLEELIDDVYSYAPYDFQRKFLELRKTFYGVDNAYNWDIENYKRLSEPLFRDTFETFPVHEFKELEGEYELVKTFIDIKLKGDWKFKVLEQISRDFWFLFCYHLRLKPSARENIPPDILHHWREKLPMDTDRHRKSIADMILKSVDEDRDLLENDIIRDYYLWRKKDKEKTEKLIVEFVEDHVSAGTV